jgi:hypothetical protein
VQTRARGASSGEGVRYGEKVVGKSMFRRDLLWRRWFSMESKSVACRLNSETSEKKN